MEVHVTEGTLNAETHWRDYCMKVSGSILHFAAGTYLSSSAELSLVWNHFSNARLATKCIYQHACIDFRKHFRPLKDILVEAGQGQTDGLLNFLITMVPM